MLKSKFHNAKWFTLIELIVVMTIMTILSTVGLIAINSTTDEDLIVKYVNSVQDRSQEMYSKAIISKNLPLWTKFLKLSCDTSVATKMNFYAYTCTTATGCSQIFFPTSNYWGGGFDELETKRWWLSKCWVKAGTIETLAAKSYIYVQTEFPYWVFIKLNDDWIMASEWYDYLSFYAKSGTLEKQYNLILK